jgi:hypothetical protein
MFAAIVFDFTGLSSCIWQWQLFPSSGQTTSVKSRSADKQAC